MTGRSFENRYGTQVARTAAHIYLSPHPALRSYIAHYTICLSSSGPAQAEPGWLTLVPDASGCLVLTFRNGLPEGRVYGPTTRTVTVLNDLSGGPLRFFVEFRPGGLYAFTGLPQWELRDRVLPLDQAAPALSRLVNTCCLPARDLDGFAAALDTALLALGPRPSPVLPMLDLLRRDVSPTPLQSLTGCTGYSPRHLSRLLREGAGLGVKSFTRVVRINRAVRLLQAGAPSLTRLAQELGYYDQAHFIHDFKTVCGVTPGRYRQDLSAFYNEPLKF